MLENHDGRVFNGLSAPELGIAGREKQRGATELGHTRLEGDSGAGGRFLEDHCQDTIFQSFAHGALAPIVAESSAVVDQTF